MEKKMIKYLSGLLSILFCSLAIPASAGEKTLTIEELLSITQKQQEEIEALKKKSTSLETKVEMTADRIEESSGMSKLNNLNIGGYGEIHYNNLDSRKELDFHRFVLFINHDYSEKIKFFSELELEHAIAGESQSGEIELEQAYIDFAVHENHSLKGGLFLVPVGILNETHEPPTFYGVERNPIEKNIIPSTWWEGGVGASGKISEGLSYDLTITTGLAVDSTSYKIRSGRQKGAKANAEKLAYTARIKWAGIPGIELAATYQHQEDLTQDSGAAGTDSEANLFETHAIIHKGNFGLRALYARWDLDGSGPEALGRDEQTGWYIEPSYRFSPSFGIFARHNEYDTEAGNSSDTEKRQTDIGFNYWPHEDIVIKFDIQNQSGANDDDGYNIGLGYQF